MCSERFSTAMLRIVAVVAFLSGSPSLSATEGTSLPDAVAERLELVALLKSENFVELQSRIMGEFAKAEGDARGSVKSTNALNAFSTADPNLAGPLARWREKFPDSFVPHLAFGFYASTVGGEIRGEQLVYLTNKKRFEEMLAYFEVAKGALKTALRINPELEAAWIGLINIAKVTGKKFEMIDYLNKGVESLPKHSGVYWTYFKAIAPKWGGSFKQRLALKIRIMADYPNDPDFAWLDSEEDFEDAWKLYYNERYAAALEKFQALAAVRETSARSRGIAWSLAALDRKNEGIAAMEKAVSMNPTNADLYEELARLQRFYPDLRAAARRNLDIALALQPYSPKFLLARARMRLADGQMKSAKRDLDNALFFGGYDAAVHDGLRQYHLALDDADAAVEDARKMVALVPKNLKNYLVFGVTLFQSEDCRAGEVLRKYLDACRWSKDCTNDDLDQARMTIQLLGFSCS